MKNPIRTFIIGVVALLALGCSPAFGQVSQFVPGQVLTAAGLNQALGNVFGKVDARWYGVSSDPTCAKDNTSPIRLAVTAAAGSELVFPTGTFCLNTATSTILISSQIEISGQGRNTVFKWNAPSGSAIAPIFDVTAAGITMHDFAFDHNAQAGNYVDSTYFGTDPWGGVAFSIQGDKFTGYNLYGANGFDNCIGISKRTSSGAAVAGSPQHFLLHDINTTNCGTGIHSAAQGGPGKIGAGIDNGSGSAGVISNVVDNQSYIGFISDIGAGAYAQWNNATAFYTKIDSSNPTNGSGYGLYVGAPMSSFTNVTIVAPAGTGVWNDNPAAGTNFNNLTVYIPQKNCLWLKGAITANNVTCNQSSFSGSNGYADVLLDSTAGSISPLQISNLNISGALHSYSVQATGSNPINGVISSNALTGVTAPTSLGSNAAGLSLIGTSTTGVSISAAQLTSPTLTGTPTAPTASVGTSSTQVATTQFVAASYAPLASPTFTGTVTIPSGASIAGYLTSASASSTYAPLASPTFTGTVTIPSGASIAGYLTSAAASSTYAPLASPTFTGTVTIPSGASIAGYLTSASAASTYAPLASPALTGTPTAPTATAGTNTTQVATTAFANSAVTGGGNAGNFTTGSFTDSSTSNTQQVTISATSDTLGASIKMTGNGGTTPSKYVRVQSGNFAVVNNANTAAILSLTDAGALTTTGAVNGQGGVQSNGVTINPVLTGTTASIGGSSLAAGACTSGTASISGSTTSMAVAASPVTYPGDGFWWEGYVSAAGTVTVKVCAVAAGTPTASAYNVRVLQ
ncbi:beta strand repeat-containing protein [Burkholderia cepacia]|uniref:beta strand repeat-containing protein n=1 Tax=Burkholderia cepacia TaxID=292 RepID=UPI0011BFBC19|nr:hypothetical protein [Burkholderia cepacia]